MSPSAPTNRTDAPPTLRASETAQAIAAMVGGYDEQTVQEMHRMIGHLLAAPAEAQLRLARLGLLIEIVAVGTGEIPSHQDYESERAERRAIGEEWMSAVTVSHAYGGWLPAVRAAMRLTHGFGNGISSGKTAVAGDATIKYTQLDALTALRQCAAWLGAAPRPQEYKEWRLLTRRAARVGGNPLPRLPSLARIRQLFGSYAQGLALARRSTRHVQSPLRPASATRER